MAPVGMVSAFVDWHSLVDSSSPPVGLLSVFILLALSITVSAMCARCRKKDNTYDINGTELDKNEPVGHVNAAQTKDEGDADVNTGDTSISTWRSHTNMPANTLERNQRARSYSSDAQL